MKIDTASRITAKESAATQTSSKPPAPTEPAERSRERDDPSSAQSRAAGLTAQVNQLPEIRQEKVAAIAAALRQGTYQVSPEQTAEAILSQLHLCGGNAAAPKGEIMADPFTDRVGPAAPAAEPMTRQAQRDIGAGKECHPAENDTTGNDDLLEDTESLPHRIDRRA